MKLTVTFVLLLVLIFNSCEKKNETPDDCIPLKFISLTAENDTIELGGDVRITAEADGDGLVYEWTKTLGVIQGSGESVIFFATPCAVGEIEVTCTVVDRCNKSETMVITIIVL